MVCFKANLYRTIKFCLISPNTDRHMHAHTHTCIHAHTHTHIHTDTRTNTELCFRGVYERGKRTSPFLEASLEGGWMPRCRDERVSGTSSCSWRISFWAWGSPSLCNKVVMVTDTNTQNKQRLQCLGQSLTLQQACHGNWHQHSEQAKITVPGAVPHSATRLSW